MVWQFADYSRRECSNSRVFWTARSSHGRPSWLGSRWASTFWKDSCLSGSIRCCNGLSRPRCWKMRCRKRCMIEVRYIPSQLVIGITNGLMGPRNMVAQKQSLVSSLVSTVKFRIWHSSMVTFFRSSGVSAGLCWLSTSPLGSRVKSPRR